MRKPIILISLGFLILAGCSQTGSPPAASAPSAMSDSDLQNAIQARLNADPDLSAAKLDIDAHAKDNKVTLKGTVPTESMRLRAVELAKAGNPNLEITDKIDVKPKELSRSDDAWIHTKVTSKLIGEKDTPARKINVDVVDGIVTLRGEVHSTIAKDEADRVAKDTEGVRRVRNLLKVTAG